MTKPNTNKMENTNLTGFIYQPSYAEARKTLKKLNDDKLVIAFDDALINYAIYGEEPDFTNPILEMTWKLIEPTLSKSVKNYKVKIENGKKKGKKDTKEEPQPETTVKEQSENELNHNSSSIVVEEIKPKKKSIVDYIADLPVNGPDTK